MLFQRTTTSDENREKSPEADTGAQMSESAKEDVSLSTAASEKRDVQNEPSWYFLFFLIIRQILLFCLLPFSIWTCSKNTGSKTTILFHKVRRTVGANVEPM